MTGVTSVLPEGQQVAVGLVGPHDLLERIVLAAGLPGQPAGGSTGGRDDDSSGRRLVLAAYRSEQEARQRVSRLAGGPHSWLFASPVPLEYARRAGLLHSPAIAIAGPAAIASYHARLYRTGQATIALTCLDEVARRLTATGVPVVTVRPAEPAIATALRIATLLAWRRVLAASQLAVAVIEVPALRHRPGGQAFRHGREELRHAVHGMLLRAAHQLGAVVSPAGEHGFLVIGSSGSLIAGEPVPPLAAAVAAELKVDLEAGVGTGRTAREAESRAREHLRQTVTAAAGSARVAGPRPASWRRRARHRANPRQPAIPAGAAARASRRGRYQLGSEPEQAAQPGDAGKTRPATGGRGEPGR